MNRFLKTLGGVLAVTFIGAGRAHAQLGPLIDWIHEMSGPRFFQWGATYSIGYQPGLRLRVDIDSLATRLGRAGGGPIQNRLGIQSTLAQRADQLRDLADRFSTDVRYKAVLVDRIQAEVRRFTRDLERSPDMNDARRLQVAERTDRLIAAFDDLRDIDALDRGNGMRARLAILGGTSALSASKKEPDTAAINLISVSPTAEYLIIPQLAFETGIGIHYFFGDIEPFWAVSLPLLIVARPFADFDSRFVRSLRINFGKNVFAPLQGGAFEPVSQVPGTGLDWVWTGYISIDFPFR